MSVSGGGAHAIVDGAKPHVSSSSENIFFTNWGYGTYTLTASPGSPYVFITDATEISAGEPNGTNSVKKTITDTSTNPENFSLGMHGKMYIPGGEGGSPIAWSASINTKFFYIKSNQAGGAKTITVPAGTSVTYTAYEGSSSVSADWTANGEPKNNESSIIFNRSWWDVASWYIASMGTPKPGTYAISARPTGKSSPSDSGTMTVVGVKKLQASINGDAFTDVSGTIIVGVGENLIIKAIPEPGEPWPSGMPVWSQNRSLRASSPATSGSEKIVDTSLPTDITVTAQCGSSSKNAVVKVVRPKNFRMVTHAPIPGQRIDFTYTWESSSGTLSDLAGFEVGEHVFYRGGGTPRYVLPYPFAAGPQDENGNYTVANPTTLSVPGANGTLGDQHMLWGYRIVNNQYQSAQSIADQNYWWKSTRLPNQLNDLLTGIIIIRTIEYRAPTWYTTLTKSGYSVESPIN